jgi:hypothetical protein
MDIYQKTETVQAEQWNKPGDVKEAKVEMDGHSYRVNSASGGIVRPGDYIVRGYNIKTDRTFYYPIPKEDFEEQWSKVDSQEGDDGEAYAPTQE